MRKLALSAAGYAAAVTLAHYILPLSALPLCAGVCAALFIAALLLRRWETGKRAALLLSFAAVGFLWYMGYGGLMDARAEVFAQRELTVSARVSEYPVRYDDYACVYVRLTDDRLPGGRALLYDTEGYSEGLRPGDELQVRVSFADVLHSGGEETDAYTSEGLTARGYMLRQPEVTGRWRFSFLYFPRELARITSETAARLFPESQAGFMRGLLIGDKTGLYGDPLLDNSLSVSGIRHVAAVSGMHLGFLYGALSLLLGKRRSAFVALPVIVVFTFMAGCTPSVVRAAAMLTLFILAPILQREADGITALAAPLLLLTLINPRAIADGGLQLSFAAMAGVILLTPPIFKALGGGKRQKPTKSVPVRVARRLLQTVQATAAASLGATILTAPITALRFGTVSLLASLTNVLTMWAVSAAFVGGYIAVAVYLLWPAAGAVCALIPTAAACFVTGCARAVSAIPMSALYTRDKLVLPWICSCYVLGGLWFLQRRRSERKGFWPPLAACLATLAFLLVSQLAAGLGAPTVTVADTGRGLSVVLRTPGSAVIVDAGGDWGRSDAGAELLLSMGRRRVDALVLTELSEEYAGGAASLLAQLDVGTLVLPSSAEDKDWLLPGILSMAERTGAETVYVDSAAVMEYGDIELTLYGYPAEAGGASSLCALAKVRGTHTLITAGAGSPEETALAESYELPRVSLLIAGDTLTAGFPLLSEVLPPLTVISVGEDPYGLPGDETLTRLRFFGSELRRTDTEGEITVRITEHG